MIISIYGENNYSSLMKLIELKAKFIEKYGDINTSIFEVTDKNNINSVISEVKTPPFLSSKRLIIIKYLFELGSSKEKEKMLEMLPGLPESSILIFYEKATPKKNDKLTKKVQSLARNYFYPNLERTQLVLWIKNEVKNRGGNIENDAASKLSFIAGNNTWLLSGEINKLIDYSYPKAINSSDIDLLVREVIDAKIFDLVDSLACRDLKSSFINLHKLIAAGEKDLYILSMINYGFRNLVLVKYLRIKNKNISEFEISKKLGLHPYVIKKSFHQSESFSLYELKHLYNQLLAIDEGIKTGKKNSLLSLDLFIADLCLNQA